MTSNSIDSLAGRASQACVACRKQKRKCDKVLPACMLCNRMGRSCEYAETFPIPSADEFSALQQRVQELEARIENSSPSDNSYIVSPSKWSSQSFVTNGTKNAGFPLMFFLDTEGYVDARLTVLQPSLPVPSEVAVILGTISDITSVAETYFSTIHTWLPMVSKKRLYQSLAAMTSEPCADLALLLNCMKLVLQTPGEGPESSLTPLYWTAKQFLSLLETNGMLTVKLIQSAILIAVYEIGNGVYPAAYLTTGHCARLGHALGLHDRRNVHQILRKPGTWTEQEEMLRIWWSVLLLDRYVNLGPVGRLPASDEPLHTHVLPTHDVPWDQGEMTASEPIFVSSPTSLQAGPFTRTCQVTYLVGRLIRHRNDISLQTPYQYSEALQLHRTMLALSSLLPSEFEVSPERLSTAMALCHGAMLALYDSYCCLQSRIRREAHSAEELEMQEISINGLQTTADAVLRFITYLQGRVSYNIAAASPLIADCLYQAAATYLWLVRETDSPVMVAKLKVITDALQSLNRRWKVASGYLRLLEATTMSLKDESQSQTSLFHKTNMSLVVEADRAFDDGSAVFPYQDLVADNDNDND